MEAKKAAAKKPAGDAQRGKKRRAGDVGDKTKAHDGHGLGGAQGAEKVARAGGTRASPLRRLTSGTREAMTPPPSAVKPFVRGEMADSIKHMMYGFGDAWEPDSDTVELMEEITIEYIRSMTKKALDLSIAKGKLDADCLIFLVRKYPEKLERVKELLAANELLKNVLNSGFDPLEEK
ncbi:hypothetical protein SPRG_06810 [Saprolegnia parasitica CBS 223.65]|uniref:Transcription initiation factor TFIID subunit 13 n=1 Tax=Saprolegnia parasitica (strain CBS 223.65) TaxID=695850 RepID=A0A067CL55_SAPPC|nr:hypothetical protein SPRG_06810 [Saprolegnia parasitica CBS 223.65]KDO27542.1 hypothetical protein SPRG_06810 [Saprolegnia parasitica CBS 223.65]|eukprot:XP_012201668.1 hypothetical protein SPRG_06810 [Saprolegnia parasitica CBS 223.65]